MNSRLIDTLQYVKMAVKVAAIPVILLTIIAGPIVIVISGLNLIAAALFLYFTYK